MSLFEYITVHVVGYARLDVKSTVAVYLIQHDKVYGQVEWLLSQQYTGLTCKLVWAIS